MVELSSEPFTIRESTGTGLVVVGDAEAAGGAVGEATGGARTEDGLLVGMVKTPPSLEHGGALG